MSEEEFTQYYEANYPVLLRSLLRQTRDFFIAEEAASQTLLEFWQADMMPSMAVLRKRGNYRVIDLHNDKIKIMGYVRLEEDEAYTPPLTLDPDVAGVFVESTALNGERFHARSAEDIALDVIELKEALANDEKLWSVLMDTELSPTKWHGTLTGYDTYACRCAECKAMKSAYMLAKGRTAGPRPQKETHCVNGHAYTEGSYSIKSTGGKRCKLCRKKVAA